VIHTKLHVVKDIMKGKDVDNVVIQSHARSLEGAYMVVDEMMEAPTYCMDAQIVNLLVRDDVSDSILAIMNAGIARLPYDPMLVEFSPPTTHPCRYFVLMRERPGQVIRTTAACLSKNDTELVVMADPLNIEIVEGGMICTSAMEDDPFAWASMAAVSLSLLMLNTKGIEKQVIFTGRLNKARAKHNDGRTPVPQHTVVRIGTIYDRSGRGHSATATGRHMPVHLRAGHVRRQHFGKGNEEVKQIFIPPCIVNFKDESGEKPKIPHKTITL